MKVLSPLRVLRTLLFVGLVANLALKPATAEITPDLLDDRFGWERGDIDAHHVGWNSFQDELGTGQAFDAVPIILDTTPDSSSVGSTGEVRETGTTGGFISGSGGIYSFSGALQFENKLSGAGLRTGYTRVVAQLRTWGTELDLNSVLLSSSTQTTPISPAYVEELGRISIGPPPQGSGPNDQVDTLLLWDLVGSDAEYSIALSAPGAHMTFKEFYGDVFSKNSPFVTPSVVPEPSSLLTLSTIVVGAVVSRRRKSRGG